MKPGLSHAIRTLQNQRDAGILSAEEYRRQASAAVEETQINIERAALAHNESIQPLTGAVGVMVETHCKESWQQTLSQRWRKITNKRTVMIAAFVILVGLISALVLLDEDTSIDAMIDHGAGAVEHEVSSTLLEDIEADNSE
mmetsp:Transcript_36167/g.92443  ORF Transcript_36167/g.92443 Transcript_36167/m.92443 type:complete len:142 (-) Transcript_36167:201-626(-)|eukprot:jgi/Tetstr1/460840/TSEL_006001.t1